MTRWRTTKLLIALLLLGALFLPAGGEFSWVARRVHAQGGPPPRPTLNPTQRPLTVEPIETIRASLTVTVSRTPTRTVTPTASATAAQPSPVPPSPTLAFTASATLPPPSATSAPPPTLAPPTPTTAATPAVVPVTGGAGGPSPSLNVLLAISLGAVFLSFVGGVYVGLTNTSKS